MFTSCVPRVPMYTFPVTVPTSPADAMYFPPGDQATALSQPLLCLLYLSSTRPEWASQICAVLSQLQDAIRLSSADQATEDTFLPCSLKTRRACPLVASQTCTVASSLLEAMRFPSCDHATAVTLLRCPL